MSGSAAPDALVRDLRRAVGDDHVLVDPALTGSYRTDWTGRYRADTAVVVRPADTGEVVAAVDVCVEHGAAICPQGGNTGLVGASVPVGGGVVVSTRRLARLEPVDARAGTVVAGAGVTIGDVHRHAAASGLGYGIDLGSRDSATVGGTIATNAGGIHVIRRGMTRDNVTGIEAVLADGSVVGNLAGLPKDNTGYHLPGLFCGSEGTLGIVTAATLALHHLLPERVTALIGFATPAAAVAAVDDLCAAHLPLDAVEFMVDAGIELVRSTFGLPAPIATRSAAYLLVECSDVDPVDARLAATIAAIAGVTDAAVAVGTAPRDALWRYRDLHTESIGAASVALGGPPVKLDVTVPLARLAAFVDEVAALVAAEVPAATVWLFGHAGDGNLHVNLSGVAEPDEAHAVDTVLAYVTGLGGSISAEHGVGRLKRPWIERQRGSADIAAFRAIKSALDPGGLFQPGVLLPGR